MNNKIIIHSILCTFFIHSSLAMDENTGDNKIISLSSSSNSSSPHNSPQISPRNSPITTSPILTPTNSRENLKQLIKSNSSPLIKRTSTRDLLKKPLIFFQHSAEDEQWYEIKPEGTFNKDNMLSQDKRKEHYNRYAAEFVIAQNNNVILRTTHTINEEHGRIKINPESQFSLPTALTKEQCIEFTNRGKMIFAIDYNKNSYCISWIQESLDNNNDDDNSVKEHSDNSDSDTIANEKCIADVYDTNNNKYQIWLVEAYNTIYMEIDKKNDDDEKYSLLTSDELPQHENVYLDLLDIAENQAIAVDKDANIYIRTGEIYKLQTNSACDKIVTIRPLELKKQNNTKEKPITNDANDNKDTKEISSITSKDHTKTPLQTQSTPKLNPNDNNHNKFNKYTIAGSITLVGLVMVIIYNKLPNMRALLNSFLQRTHNVNPQ